MNYKAFCAASYHANSYTADQERTVNLYPSVVEGEGATAKIELIQTPGVRLFLAVDAVGWRASVEINGRCFAVVGSTFYEITQSGGMGVGTVRGTVDLDNNPATINANGITGDQLFITSGGKGYCYELTTNVLTEIPDLVATSGGFIDGYFVAFNVILSQDRISDLFDGQVWDPTQFLGRSTQADAWAAMYVTPYQQIVHPGTQTGDILINTGDFPYPFAPDRTGAFTDGIAAGFSICQAGKSTVWLASNNNGGYQVLAAQGYNPTRISDHGLERAIAGYALTSRIDDAIGQTFENQGHAFYRLTFPAAQATWQYDFLTQTWVEVLTWIPENNAYTYFRPVFHCFAFQKHLMGDRQSGNLYWMSEQFSTDILDHSGTPRPMVWLRRAPCVCNERKRVFFNRFELIMETGVGLVTGDDPDVIPIVTMRYSNNFGQTWSSQRTASIGAVGEYWVRPFWNRLSSGRGRVFECAGSAKVPYRISGATLDVTKSTEGQQAA